MTKCMTPTLLAVASGRMVTADGWGRETVDAWHVDVVRRQRASRVNRHSSRASASALPAPT